MGTRNTQNAENKGFYTLKAKYYNQENKTALWGYMEATEPEQIKQVGFF